jgi:hypothetical protein
MSIEFELFFREYVKYAQKAKRKSIKKAAVGFFLTKILGKHLI